MVIGAVTTAVVVLAVDGALAVAQLPVDGGAGDFVGLVNYGVLGLLVLGFITGRIRTDGEAKECIQRVVVERARAENAEARERDLYDAIREESAARARLAEAAVYALTHREAPPP